jgi:hypothetical protein
MELQPPQYHQAAPEPIAPVGPSPTSPLDSGASVPLQQEMAPETVQPQTAPVASKRRGLVVGLVVGVIALLLVVGVSSAMHGGSDSSSSASASGSAGTPTGGTAEGNANTSVNDSSQSSDAEGGDAGDGDAQSTDGPSDSPSNISSQARVTASHTLKGYPASNLVDGKFSRAWAEGVKGYGAGESVLFTFPSDVWITSVRVVPGYVKYDSKNNVDRWYSNGRVASAKLVFSDGSESNEFSFDTDQKDWQDMQLDEPKRTSSVKFVITSTAPAQTGTNHDASDTTISEMRVMGSNQ